MQETGEPFRARGGAEIAVQFTEEKPVRRVPVAEHRQDQPEQRLNKTTVEAAMEVEEQGAEELIALIGQEGGAHLGLLLVGFCGMLGHATDLWLCLCSSHQAYPRGLFFKSDSSFLEFGVSHVSFY